MAVKLFISYAIILIGIYVFLVVFLKVEIIAATVFLIIFLLLSLVRCQHDCIYK